MKTKDVTAHHRSGRLPIEALQLMMQHKISGLPVVNTNGNRAAVLDEWVRPPVSARCECSFSMLGWAFSRSAGSRRRTGEAQADRMYELALYELDLRNGLA